MQRFINYVIIFIIIIAAGLVSGLIILNVAFKTKEVNVPNVLGMDSIAALRALNEYQINMVIVEQEHSIIVSKNHIISQQPEAGSRVKKKKSIKVVLSLGKREMTAPDLVGISLRKAKIELNQRGFNLKRITTIHDNNKIRDTVLAQNPLPGGNFEIGAEVSLMVSAGVKAESYVMPDVISKNIKEVATVLENMGVEAGRIEYREQKEFPPGIVLKQSPAAGYKVVRGGKAGLTLSEEESDSSARTGSFAVFNYQLPPEGPPARVKIVVENVNEVKEVFNSNREPGATVQVMIKIEGETTARVYLNNRLVKEKRF